MCLARQIDQFFRATGQSVFIEAEAKSSRMQNFLNEYNRNYQTNLVFASDGIIALDETADKRGLELRCYFHNRTDFPTGVNVTANRAYRPEYQFRFNNGEVIRALFALGYRIGANHF